MIAKIKNRIYRYNTRIKQDKRLVKSVITRSGKEDPNKSLKNNGSGINQ